MLIHSGSETIKQSEELPPAEMTHHSLYRAYQGGWQAAPGQTFYVKKGGQHNPTVEN